MRLSWVIAVWCVNLRSAIRLNFSDCLNDYLIIVWYFLLKLMQVNFILCKYYEVPVLVIDASSKKLYTSFSSQNDICY